MIVLNVSSATARLRSLRLAAVLALLCTGQIAVAQDQRAPHDAGQHATEPEEHGMIAGPLGIPMSREGSGTSWLPDQTPMNAVHVQLGTWQLMLHGNGFLQYIDEGSSRGDDQVGSVNWFMAMARHKAGAGSFTARGMISLEPWTVGACGYPDLLATGESCNGQPLHDRQHPHDLFMELAVQYEGAFNDALGYQVYAAPVGEPALGPVAFPHRPSAMTNPMAPIGHHWQDATHISFGVVTGGVFGRRWKAEASVFNGREPDENRANFDFAPLDSYSGRFWLLPSPRWAIQVSAGHLNEPEAMQVGGSHEDVNRTTASVAYHRPRGMDAWTSTIAWGRNAEAEGATNSLLAETNLPITGRDGIFARYELVGKTAADLDLPLLDLSSVFRVSKTSAGYTRSLRRIGALLPGIGASISFSVVPDVLRPFYDGRTAIGGAVFFSLRPASMAMMNMPHSAP